MPRSPQHERFCVQGKREFRRLNFRARKYSWVTWPLAAMRVHRTAEIDPQQNVNRGKTSRTFPGRPSFKSVSTYESWTLTKHSLSLKAPRIRPSHNGPRLKTECTQRHHKRRYHTRCRERTDSAFLEQAVSRQTRYSSKPVLSIRNYATYLFEVPRPAVGREHEWLPLADFGCSARIQVRL